MVESLQTIDAFAARDAADAGDDAGAVDGVVVHAVGGERRQFEERRARIDQRHHPLARQKLAARHVPLARARRPAERGFGAPLSSSATSAPSPLRWRGIRRAVSTVDDRDLAAYAESRPKNRARTSAGPLSASHSASGTPWTGSVEGVVTDQGTAKEVAVKSGDAKLTEGRRNRWQVRTPCGVKDTCAACA